MDTKVLRTGEDSFVATATEEIVRLARAAQREGGWFRMGLCGGSTPRGVYAELAQLAPGVIDWSRVRLTFGDERSVPPDHADSNYRMARESLLDHVPIPAENVLRIEAERAPEVAAERCESGLRSWAREDGTAIFRHDLMLLGMGDDGHTASLFPGTEALREEDRWVVANFVPKFDTHRITMTYPLINASRHVLFLIKGQESKGAVVERILAGGAADPAAAIAPDGELKWLLGW